ncbi:Autophagy-related protein 3 [Rhodotorula toruloides]|nr:Autophagy-related protein 3 [Rhodotorula toruloides]
MSRTPTLTHFWAVRDYLAPVLRDSKFKETGRITPDEFVAAGDFLVYKFPTWQWEAGEPGKARDFLPKDKQYLISRNVPCLRRVSQLGQQGGANDEYAETLMHFTAELDEGEVAAGDAGDEWVATHTSAKDPNSTSEIPVIGDIPDVDDPSAGSSSHAVDGLSSHLADTSIQADDIPDLDDIPDMDDEDAIGGGLIEEEDDAAVKVEPVKKEGGRSDNIIQVRTYDCMITYDKYYQTPRMWLLGYDEQKRPLPPTSALEDVSSDHALKTVTIEPFPHSSSLSIASVHPCKHSSVMKKVIERMDGNVRELQRREKAASGSGVASQEKEKKTGGGKWLGLGKKREKSEKGDKPDEGDEDEEGLRVEQYLLVFLKFISTITPTIEVDSTASI